LTMPRIIEQSISVSLAAVCLLFLGPLVLCLALLIYLVDGRPVLFPDPWTNRRGKAIMLSAFRTHRIRALPQGVGSPLPWVGWYLQMSGLEKLPRLWDILRGRCEIDSLWR
jgi:lipopolysaccharide/colanic/teichoic acid biosynthesis glycosyltransferase